MPRDGRRNDVILVGGAALILLALALLFFHQLAFTSLILARGDTFNYFYPYWAARNAALAQGQLPLWTPDLFMGVPLLANSQLGTFYPLNWLLRNFSAPEAIRLSILMHIYLALLGAYALTRTLLTGRGWPRELGAIVAAVMFGLGGYVGAHVEQINQLQGIAWLPWLVLIYHHALRRKWLIPLLAMGIALQFFSGHTQMVFIMVVCLGVYGLAQSWHGLTQETLRQSLISLLVLGGAGLISIVLILPQALPTVELMDVSNRRGGMNANQALAFSLNPLLAGRGLLPSYDAMVFGEYIGYGGIVGIALACVGLLSPLQQARRWPWLVLVIVGFALAFGEFNPLNWTLATLPGFNLFRVPARWLVFVALGGAVLAGMGTQRLLLQREQLPRRVFVALIASVAVLAAASLLSTHSAHEVVGPALPTAKTWLGWGLALSVAVILLLGVRRWPQAATGLLALALTGELLLASSVLPYNSLVTPDSYHAQRFSISQLSAFIAEETAPSRTLSISNLLFDPGDHPALTAYYQAQGLSDLAIRQALVNTKIKETLTPNQPLIWGIPSIDGFDGGVLPTAYYTAFTSLMLPEGELRTIDGRLREILARESCRGACLPDQRWLNMTDVQYLITDKVYDLWHEGVAYDTQFSLHFPDDVRVIDLPLPPFTFDAVDLLHSPDALFHVGTTAALLPQDSVPVEAFSRTRYQYESEEASRADALQITLSGAAGTLYAVTLVDTRTGDFVQLVPDVNWQRVLSSDVKIYENQAVLPRAWVVNRAQWVQDNEIGTEHALQIMRDPAYDPLQLVVLSGEEVLITDPSAIQADTAQAHIRDYSAEVVTIDVQADQAGYLVLNDAYYPGWLAWVNDAPVTVHRANAMFRAVAVPAGESVVQFRYEPWWLPFSGIVGFSTWGILGAVTLGLWLLRKKKAA